MLNRDGLLASAKDFADRALTAYIEDDTAVVLSHAATSLEHLAKAVLCSRNPVLLMDIQRGKLDSLVQLAGLPELAKKQEGPYTISGTEAINRVELLWPGIKKPKEIDKLIAVRNMTLHVGQHQVDDIRELLAAYLRLANELLEELKVPEAERWGERADLVESLVSKSLDEIERRVAQRMAQAKYKLDAWLSKVPGDMREAVLMRTTAIVAVPVMEHEDWVPTVCPVCGSTEGLSVGEPVYLPDVDVDINGPYVSGEGGYELYAERFSCPTCGFEVEGPEELIAAGLETNLDLPKDLEIVDEGPWTRD